MEEIIAGVEIVDRVVNIGGKVVDIVQKKLDHNMVVAAETIQQADAVLSLILKAANVATEINRIIQLRGPYGIIHKQALIQYEGKNAKLVWDYLLWNSLTVEVFVPGDVSLKYIIATQLSDEESERWFDSIVAANK